ELCSTTTRISACSTCPRRRAKPGSRPCTRPRGGPPSCSGPRSSSFLSLRRRAAGVGWLSWSARGHGRARRSAPRSFTAASSRPPEPAHVPSALPAACAWAILAALAGLWLWDRYVAMAEWYTFVWLPALAGVLVPARPGWSVVGIATVAGTAATLVTWGAAVEGQLRLGEQDALRLGREGDAAAVARLERLGRALPSAVPRTAGDLYAFWAPSALAADDYPASLAVWSRAGEPEAEIRLASMDLSPPL